MNYLGTAVGNRSKFGIQTGIMPGVFVGKDCVIGPGSVVFQNVPNSARIITRFQTQILK